MLKTSITDISKLTFWIWLLLALPSRHESQIVQYTLLRPNNHCRRGGIIYCYPNQSYYRIWFVISADY